MRVAVVTTSYPSEPGDAAGHFVETEALLLARAGHDVTVCTPGKTPEQSAAGEIRVVRLGASQVFTFPGALPRIRQRPHRLLATAAFVRRVRTWLDTHGPFDLIQAHWLLPCGWPIAKGYGTVLEVVCHGSDIELLLKLPKALQRRILTQLSKDGAELRFVSHELRRRLDVIAPALCARSIVKPCAIDTSSAPSRSGARSVLAIAPETRVALVIARLIPSKRVDQALSCLTAIPTLRTLVLGDGPLRKELASSYPNAEFLGQLSRPDTLRWLAAADLLVSTSESEGAPTVIREARQLGIPAVAREIGDLRYWANDDPGLRIFRNESELETEVKRIVGLPTPSPPPSIAATAR